MATVWSRAAKASTFTARSLLRASRSGVVLTRHIRPSAARWLSALAAMPKAQEVDASEFELPVDPIILPKHKAESAIESDQPEFSSLKGLISHDTLKAITVSPMKLTHLSSVQAAVLPLLPDLIRPYDPSNPPDDASAPRDILVKARTGTGKTLAFLVPAIEARLRAVEAAGKQAVIDAGLVSDHHLEARARRVFSRKEVGALIISPTRELATQIANEAIKLTEHHKEFQVQLFVGGNSKRTQMREFMRGRRDIVVATPGRLRDLLDSEADVLEGVSKAKMLILDEADTLLEMGFREDIEAITRQLPPTPHRQTFLFSATVSRAIQQVARAAMDKNHTFINCVSDSAPPVHAHVPQYHTVLPSAGHQIPHLLRLIAHDQLTNQGKSKIIVFLPTTKMTQLFSTFLRMLSKTCLPAGKATHVYEIHSLRKQEQRTKTSDTFRNDRSSPSVLVSSDVSARGVDYPGVTRVIQVGVPASSTQYIHRVGRTGRGTEHSGRADLILLPWEIGFVTWQLTDIPMKPLTVTELKSQVDELVKQYDENPASVFPRSRTPVSPFIHPFAPAYENMDQTIASFLESLNDDDIKEVLGSLLGYYIARSHELRVQRPIVVTGLKDWTVEACGLPQPPYISEAFLHKLGINDGRTGNNSQAKNFRRPVPSAGPQASWMGRGTQRLKDARREGGSTSNFSSSDRYGDREDRGGGYKSDRYGDREGGGYKGRDGGFGGRDDRRGGKSDRYGGGDRNDRYGDRGGGRFSERADGYTPRDQTGEREGGGFSRPHHEAKHKSFR